MSHRIGGFALALLVVAGCQAPAATQSRWQQGYEDGCLHARGATPETCEARAAAVESMDTDYRAGWAEGYEACKSGPDGC